jgi:cell fate regulator YaaT (PSP1 superfamily)
MVPRRSQEDFTNLQQLLHGSLLANAAGTRINMTQIGQRDQKRKFVFAENVENICIWQP